MIPVLQFNDSSSLANYIGDNEISQEYNANSNARLFILPDKTRVIKLFTNLGYSTAKNMDNLIAISRIMRREDYPSIILPSALISLQGHIVGYEMDYVSGVDFGDALQSARHTHQQKIEWFNQLAGIIISLPEGVFVGDLHAQNVMVRNDNNIVLVDIDGFSLENQHSLTSPAQYIEGLPSKYYDAFGHLKITRETDILCLFRIFFRYLFDGIDITGFSFAWKKELSNYLRLRGAGIDFIEATEALFSNTKNILNPDLFSCWSNLLPNNEYQIFLKLTKLDKLELKAKEYINAIINEAKNKRQSDCDANITLS